MPTPQETIWPIEPHTQAKHEILSRYLGAWFPILGSWQGRIIYMDGFAGPGEYTGGESGSPIIALDVAANHPMQVDCEQIFWFVDEDKRRADHLQSLIDQQKYPGNFIIEVVHGQFHEVLTRVLDNLEQAGSNIAPTFAFIDPFGFSGVAMNLVHRLLNQGRTEAFINFPIGAVNRFIEHPDLQIQTHMLNLFGTDEALEVARSDGDRVANLRTLYQQQLRLAAKYVRFFQMRNRQNAPVYDLFFAGNHELGHYRMKEAMWRVDPDGEFTFSDATNPEQLILFTTDNSPHLLDSICQQFQGSQEIQVRRVKRWVRNSTPFLDTHMRAALRLGEESGRLDVLETKADGKKRRRGTYPDNVIISIR